MGVSVFINVSRGTPSDIGRNSKAPGNTGRETLRQGIAPKFQNAKEIPSEANRTLRGGASGPVLVWERQYDF